jgi:Na+-transporting methylmalonyl-CoA/oxaloacetate decarboxylase gamma subunit
MKRTYNISKTFPSFINSPLGLHPTHTQMHSKADEDPLILQQRAFAHLLLFVGMKIIFLSLFKLYLLLRCMQNIICYVLLQREEPLMDNRSDTQNDGRVQLNPQKCRC